MTKFPQITEEVKKAITAGLNVLLEGPIGAGKTALACSAAKDLGYCTKYFSTPTLDPFCDFVGLPYPVVEDHNYKLHFVRPDSIHQAEVFFFDELNRAHPKTLNAVFEVTQFHTINGEALPRLRSVVAAINPASAGYHVLELDPALLDRFHVHLRVAFGPDREWFIERFGKHLGGTLLDWHQTDLDSKQREAISNRRLEYIGLAIKAGIDPWNALPGGTNAPVHLLTARLNQKGGDGVLTIEQFANEPEKFTPLVTNDLNVAIRFAQLLPMMNPYQKNRVRDLVLVLPAEILARLKAEKPFLFKKICQAVARYAGKEDARAFEELLEERLKTIAP